MKSFHCAVWTILALFSLIMAVVVIAAFGRKSNICKLDPAQIHEIRMQG